LQGEFVKRKYLDLLATLGFLESFEPDLDLDRIAFVGYSAGALMAPDLLALEPRLTTAVLMSTGNQWTDGSNPMGRSDIFLPHVTQPTLIINGRYDCYFDLEEQVKPIFELLGTPAGHKSLEVLETSHGMMEKRYEVIRIVREWLDRYLGPVGGAARSP
jgi:pimeloyl-ACP methyl ester carboxylesterase